MGWRLSEDEKAQLLFEIEERAAIKEFEGGMSRAQAEHEARRETVALWSPSVTYEAVEKLKAEADVASKVEKALAAQQGKK